MKRLGRLLSCAPHLRMISVHHIFFDDNIQRDQLHIIDVRDVNTGDPIPFADVIDTWVCVLSKLCLIPSLTLSFLSAQMRTLRVADP